MDAEIKQRWITKLNSGDYEQTTGKLSDGEGYCCLGVLCEIAIEDGVVFKTEDDDEVEYVSKLDPADNNAACLPKAVVRWSGLPDENPNVDEDHLSESARVSTLAELNDYGFTFPQLAELIEKNF